MVASFPPPKESRRHQCCRLFPVPSLTLVCVKTRRHTKKMLRGEREGNTQKIAFCLRTCEAIFCAQNPADSHHSQNPVLNGQSLPKKPASLRPPMTESALCAVGKAHSSEGGHLHSCDHIPHRTQIQITNICSPQSSSKYVLRRGMEDYTEVGIFASNPTEQ